MPAVLLSHANVAENATENIIVIETVTETNGRIKLGGETWSARVPAHAESCPPGSDVQVIALHGATAIVVAAPHPVAEPT